MKKRLQEKLLSKFPFLLRKRRQPGTWIMPYEIECGSGWYDLLGSLCEQIDTELQKESQEVRESYAVTQVKEKFGGLRVYAPHIRDVIDNMIHKAEMDSFKICEWCGCPGMLRKRRERITLCDNCDAAIIE